MQICCPNGVHQLADFYRKILGGCRKKLSRRTITSPGRKSNCKKLVLSVSFLPAPAAVGGLAEDGTIGAYRDPHKPVIVRGSRLLMMPSLSPSWPTWLQPRALVGGLGLMISAFRNLRAGLREEIREMKHESFHRRRPSLESEDQQDFHGANKARGQIKRVNTSAPCSLRLSVSLLQVGCPFMGHWLIGFPTGEVPILKGRGCVTSGEGGREDRVLRGSFLSPTAFGGWVKDGLTGGCPLLPKGLLRNSA